MLIGSNSVEGSTVAGPIASVYSLIASIAILIAVLALCSVCKKKKNSKYEIPATVHDTKEAVQEDVIQAQTTNQVKSTPLGHNFVPEDQVYATKEAVQEDVIQAQTTNQVKSTPLGHNFVPEDQVLKEDQDIFKSYMNLQYIDEQDDSASVKRQ